jgi:hypothetical protein
MSKSVFSISLLAATAFMLPAFGADGTTLIRPFWVREGFRTTLRSREATGSRGIW